VLEHWFANGVTRRDWRLSTRKDYRSALRVHLGVSLDLDGHLIDAGPPFGETQLRKLSARSIDAWLTERMRAGLPKRTAAKLLMILGAVFDDAIVPFGLTVNPARNVDRIRLTDTFHVEPYSKGELALLYAAAADEQDRLCFRVAAELGLRRGEVCAARVGNIDWDRLTFEVRGTVNHGLFTTPKSRKTRKVKIPRDLALALEGFLKRRGDPEAEALLFPGDDDGFLDGSALRRRFLVSCKKAGIPIGRFHDLRHTCLSHWGDEGMDPWKLQRMAGHASIRTSQRYIHDLEDDDEPTSETREQLNGVLDQLADGQLEEVLTFAAGLATEWDKS
jgi:integrase